MTITETIEAIRKMDDGEWNQAMIEAKDYYMLNILNSIYRWPGVYCKSEYVRLHDYMVRALKQRDGRDDE